MKRVLVTGGAGFIGSHLCERLLARGDEVLCVDNFFTSRRGSGCQSRSFCYVDDLVTGMIAMMDQDELVRRRPDIYHGEGEASLGADDPPARRPHPHDRIFPVAIRGASGVDPLDQPALAIQESPLPGGFCFYRCCHPARFVGRSFIIVGTREGTICQVPPGSSSSGCGNSRRS